MRLMLYSLVGLCLLSSSKGWSITPYEITEQNLRTHVNYLCSDALEGRLTGGKGEKKAAQYIADQFQQLGLTPAGDHDSYFQDFDFIAGTTLGDHNALAITLPNGKTKSLRLNEDWRPLAFSDSQTFVNTSLVFAGYGITSPTYDSYRGLNVKNKWVAVYTGTPDQTSNTQNHELDQYATLRYKAFTAKDHGAKGIIFINPPSAKNKLIPFSSENSTSDAGIVALTMRYTVFSDLLNAISMQGQTEIAPLIKQGRNVLAKLTIGKKPDSVIIVGAHLDHLGHGESGGSRAQNDETGMIHAGADDNASGVASVIEAAAVLSHKKAEGQLTGDKNILFAAWSGEELGVLGSSHYVSQRLKTSSKKSLRPGIDAVINLDMVGHLKKKLVIQSVASSKAWPAIINQMKQKQSAPIVMQKDPYLPTDSTAFYIEGVPAINLFTGAHDDYHTPRDKPDTLNYPGIKIVSDYLVDLVLTLEKNSQLTYQAVQKPHDNAEQEMKIYLGTIPDYATGDIVGVKLSGVAKNSPAELAGLMRDDTIIELAGKQIHDIYDYTFVLNTLPVGKPVKLVVQRGQSKVILRIVAQYRV